MCKTYLKKSRADLSHKTKTAKRKLEGGDNTPKVNLLLISYLGPITVKVGLSKRELCINALNREGVLTDLAHQIEFLTIDP